MKYSSNIDYDFKISDDFYQFRNRINKITKLDIKEINTHLNFIDNFELESIDKLIRNSIKYYNNTIDMIKKSNRQNVNYKKLIKIKKFPDNLIVRLSKQLMQLHKYTKLYPNKYVKKMTEFRMHPVISFITMLILYYLVNVKFKRNIRLYKKKNTRKKIYIKNTTIIAIIYYKLIQYCSALDSYSNLRARIRKSTSNQTNS